MEKSQKGPSGLLGSSVDLSWDPGCFRLFHSTFVMYGFHPQGHKRAADPSHCISFQSGGRKDGRWALFSFCCPPEKPSWYSLPVTSM